MTESIKTVAFVAVAALLMLAAWAARPTVPGRTIVDDKGEPFFPGFDDPLAAATLSIAEFDETAGTPSVFRVSRHDGVWSIPSHENYPADAENQFADAVASMIGLKRGTRVSDRPADHEQYGVIDPVDAAPGAVGVGKRVTISTGSDQPLADLIVGTEVRDSDGLRYVRLPGRDRVYLCEIDPTRFSTDFGQWIEKDLLQLTPTEIQAVSLYDYSIDEINNRIVQGDTLELTYDGEAFKWGMDGLGEDEELDDARLNELRRALDELQIVDVHRKPAGLSSELLTMESMQLDTEAVQSLQRRGYYVVQGRLLSNEGETIVRTSRGIQYTLRFGEIALAPGGGESEAGESSTGRYLFVTADFNEQLLPAPDFVQVPDPEQMGVNLDEPVEGEGEGEGGTASDTLRKAFEEARRKAEEENDRKREEHERKVTAGRNLADELNRRFADWYYVISDDVYQKIRLKRADVVKAAEEPDEQDSAS